MKTQSKHPVVKREIKKLTREEVRQLLGWALLKMKYRNNEVK